jgi:hypothetical protein
VHHFQGDERDERRFASFERRARANTPNHRKGLHGLVAGRPTRPVVQPLIPSQKHRQEASNHPVERYATCAKISNTAAATSVSDDDRRTVRRTRDNDSLANPRAAHRVPGCRAAGEQDVRCHGNHTTGTCDGARPLPSCHRRFPVVRTLVFARPAATPSATPCRADC